MRPAILLAAFLVSACGPAARPFIGQPSSPASPAGRAAGPEVQVRPVDGPALPMARLLAQSVAEELDALDVRATASADAGADAFVLKGVVRASWADDRTPFVVLIHWTLADAKGETVGSYIQGVRGTWWQWENGDPRIIGAVGRETARPIAAMLKRQGGVAEPDRVLETGLLVRPVRGAPGDGDRALTRAIKAAMRAVDVSVTEDPRQAAWALEGRVEVFPPRQGRQAVRVVWRVTTLDGREVGRATQENTVAVGALEGPWGALASEVAAGAVEGIESLIRGTRERRRKQPAAVSPRKVPLRPIPGRAPPPPE